MGNYFDQFDDAPAAAPKKSGANFFDRYDAPAKKKPNGWIDAAKSYASGALEGAAGLADTIIEASPVGTISHMLGGAANVAQTVNALTGRGPAHTTMEPSAPFSGASRTVQRDAYQPQTSAGRMAQTLGTMTPNALAPGGVAARVANVVLPAVGSEAAGRTAQALGFGDRGQAIARTAGAVAGGGAASLRPRVLPRAQGAEIVADSARQDPNALRQRAQEYRDAGINPTLADVVDDSGRGAVRAAATRMTPGRAVANDFARGRSLDLPDRVGAQARRTISDDPRTPRQIAEDLGRARGAAADRSFGAVRGDAITMAPETVQALRNPLGRAAIAEAARRERDPEVRSALNRLANAALDDPSTQITVGMADRISRTLLGQAEAAARGGDNDLATTFGQLGRAVRQPARAASEGYGTALDEYGAQSRLMEAADQGGDFLARNRDEFVAETPGLGQPGNELARATARRAVERAAGENTASAPGVARRIAQAPEQRARNAHLLGPEGAQRLEQGMRLEAQAVDNANMVAPRTGSWTSQNDQDAQRLAGAVQVGRRVLARDFIGLGLDYLRSRGMNDQQAEALVRMAQDPAQTNAAIEAIARRLGQRQAREFLSLRNAAMVGAISSAATGSGRTSPGQ